MTTEEKELLMVDICARLPYGIKIMVEGWDSDMDCEFTTVETLIGINDMFIYTIWDKTGDKNKHSIVEPLSILDYKPFLRPMSSMTEEEKDEWEWMNPIPDGSYPIGERLEMFDWLNAHHFDYHGLIEKGLALPAPVGMYK